MKVRVVAAALAVAAGCLIGAALAAAQVAQPGAEKTEQVQGTVGEVNVLERTIEVDGHAGLFPKKVVVLPEALVTLPSGRVGSIADIKEGDRVRATYRKVADQLVADDVTVLYSQGEAAEAPPGEGQSQGR